MLIPPAAGTFGTSGRNIWRDGGLRNWDLSVTKSFKFQERLTAQFRAEFFNILNHPNFTNPYGASSGFGIGASGDPSQSQICSAADAPRRIRLPATRCSVRAGTGPFSWA